MKFKNMINEKIENYEVIKDLEQEIRKKTKFGTSVKKDGSIDIFKIYSNGDEVLFNIKLIEYNENK